MLLELRIADFALARDVVIRPGAGLTVLTGETGAGKSLIAGALGLLAGGKAPKDLVRRGCEAAVVEGVFELTPDSLQTRALARHGVLPGSDGILVLRREIRREGRSRVLVNGSISSLAVLEAVGVHLVAVQSQDQQRELGDPGFAREYLDTLSGLEGLRKDVAAARESYLTIAEELAERREEVRMAEEQLDLWRYQYQELADAALDRDEEPELAERLSVARNAASLQEGAAAALDILGEGEWAVRERLGAAQSALASVREKSARLAEIADRLDLAAETVAEASVALSRFLDGLEGDPRSRDDLEDRQALYEELKRKYRRNVDQLLDLRDRLAERIARQEAAGHDLEELERNSEAARGELAAAAAKLRVERRAAAKPAAARAASVIRELALPDLEFSFEIEPWRDSAGPIEIEGEICTVANHGADRVRLSVRTNPGEAAGEVARIASGGERSRIHLGLTALVEDGGRQRLRLFDEVDAGLGMDNASPVARLLRSLARNSQVICITHLPTMAVQGHHHLKVAKEVRDGRTTLGIAVLDETARVAEVARLLGGEGYAGGDRGAQESYARQLLRSNRSAAAEAAEAS